MTLNVLIVAGGLLALAALVLVLRFTRTPGARIRTDQLSGDWVAQARSREDQSW